jgi:hypothetical protein
MALIPLMESYEMTQEQEEIFDVILESKTISMAITKQGASVLMSVFLKI